MPLVADLVVLRRCFASLPITSFKAGETVLAAGSSARKVLILKNGAVALVKNGIEVARVSDPGAVFGELSLSVGQPHAADVCALDGAEFYVADADTLLAEQPPSSREPHCDLAKPVEPANQLLTEVTNQLNAGAPNPAEKSGHEEPFDTTGASLVYAGYPYDPYALRYFLFHQIGVCRLPGE